MDNWEWNKIKNVSAYLELISGSIRLEISK